MPSQGDEKLSSLKLRLRITRILSKLLILVMLILLGYILMPYFQQLNIMIPIINMPLVTLGSVTILAVVGILLYRILADTLLLLNPISKAIRVIFRKMTMDHVTLVKRAIYDILFLIALIITLTALLPVVSAFPVIGIYFATGLPLIALAVVILIFWDLGKILYSEVEQLAEILAEKLESINEE
ncbi:MAG: hypothetical protein NO515_03460 [Candidatus Methanomethylicia archaeon]|jgi:hypothetical protein|nr:hypothetical protein [Candidatus Methanomethylicia archaeon]NHV61040.1 hypothetical protein [Candidatus Verstraetearchaeota archaeon]